MQLTGTTQSTLVFMHNEHAKRYTDTTTINVFMDWLQRKMSR